jgi:hypothetical protein
VLQVIIRGPPSIAPTLFPSLDEEYFAIDAAPKVVETIGRFALHDAAADWAKTGYSQIFEHSFLTVGQPKG